MQQPLRPNTRETTGLSREQVPGQRRVGQKRRVDEEKKASGTEPFVIRDRADRGRRQGVLGKGVRHGEMCGKKRNTGWHWGPVACSCLIERSSSMREIDEIRTCERDTRTCVSGSWLWMSRVDTQHQWAPPESFECIEYIVLPGMRTVAIVGFGEMRSE